MDAEAVDLSGELRHRVQFGLAAAPVVTGSPVGNQSLDRGQLNALRPVGDQFLGRPADGRDAPPQLSHVLVRHVDLEGPDSEVGGGHAYSASAMTGFPLSTTYVASSAALPRPTLRTAWTALAGTVRAAPARHVFAGWPSI